MTRTAHTVREARAARAVVAVLAAALVTAAVSSALTGCTPASGATGSAGSVSSSGCPAVFVTPVPGSTSAGDARAELAALAGHEEDTGAHYRRHDWLPHWASQGRGRDTRDVILDRDRCSDGTWLSPWDGQRVPESKVDIDHVVPLGDAARSGTRGWSAQQRHEFANDPINLRAVSAHSNRSKGDDDVAGYRPVRAVWCAYASRVIAVKTRYRLTVDDAERAALVQMLNTCRGGHR